MNMAQTRIPTPRLQQCFPERLVTVADGARVAIRECGQGPVVVLLHGIGSGSASWLHCAQRLAEGNRVIAWDAPGYGLSTPLPQARPKAVDYAARLEALLVALGVERCLLVGHSLGALMATAYAAGQGAQRVARLVLISPARGYGAEAQRETGLRVRQQRLDNLERLGIDGMASERTSRLLGRNPSEDALAWVRWNMARLNPAGYRQAVELLCGDDLLGYGRPAMPCEVHCGEDDAITSPEACGAIARGLDAPFSLIPAAGHASPIEQPDVVAGRIGHAQRLTLEGSAHGKA
ncbi:alpha/beta fold hydrolase [Metapseudomonas furukawaii]|uniref:alpha/beta fold hydrolase n=1 Tax=Metapseudomonas furukawaii TaxID=1149133 RepID=UPI00404561EE